MKRKDFIRNKLPKGVNYCLGAIADKNSNLIFYVNENSLGNSGVYKYDIAKDKLSKIHSYKSKNHES